MLLAPWAAWCWIGALHTCSTGAEGLYVMCHSPTGGLDPPSYRGVGGSRTLPLLLRVFVVQKLGAGCRVQGASSGRAVGPPPILCLSLWGARCPKGGLEQVAPLQSTKGAGLGLALGLGLGLMFGLELGLALGLGVG